MRTCIVIFLVSGSVATRATAQVTNRVSVDSAGVQGNGTSLSTGFSISGSGRYVVFESFANNLVAGDTNGFSDVFVHDCRTGTTERASVDSSGVQGNGRSAFPAISADGRYVAFESTATNLVPVDTTSSLDVFVHDRQTGTTEMVASAPRRCRGTGPASALRSPPTAAMWLSPAPPATSCLETRITRWMSSSATARAARPSA